MSFFCSTDGKRIISRSFNSLTKQFVYLEKEKVPILSEQANACYRCPDNTFRLSCCTLVARVHEGRVCWFPKMRQVIHSVESLCPVLYQQAFVDENRRQKDAAALVLTIDDGEDDETGSVCSSHSCHSLASNASSMASNVTSASVTSLASSVKTLTAIGGPITVPPMLYITGLPTEWRPVSFILHQTHSGELYKIPLKTKHFLSSSGLLAYGPPKRDFSNCTLPRGSFSITTLLYDLSDYGTVTHEQLLLSTFYSKQAMATPAPDGSKYVIANEYSLDTLQFPFFCYMNSKLITKTSRAIKTKETFVLFKSNQITETPLHVWKHLIPDVVPRKILQATKVIAKRSPSAFDSIMKLYETLLEEKESYSCLDHDERFKIAHLLWCSVTKHNAIAEEIGVPW